MKDEVARGAGHKVAGVTGVDGAVVLRFVVQFQRLLRPSDVAAFLAREVVCCWVASHSVDVRGSRERVGGGEEGLGGGGKRVGGGRKGVGGGIMGIRLYNCI